MTPETMADFHARAISLLNADAEKIRKLIQVQMDHLTMPQCPLYEEVLDTQMFGLSREVDFAIRLGVVSREEGKELIDGLERKISELHDAFVNSENQ
ncbi:MAG: YlaN family protein [Bacilli bacterium]